MASQRSFGATARWALAEIASHLDRVPFRNVRDNRLFHVAHGVFWFALMLVATYGREGKVTWEGAAAGLLLGAAMPVYAGIALATQRPRPKSVHSVSDEEWSTLTSATMDCVNHGEGARLRWYSFVVIVHVVLVGLLGWLDQHWKDLGSSGEPFLAGVFTVLGVATIGTVSGVSSVERRVGAAVRFMVDANQAEAKSEFWKAVGKACQPSIGGAILQGLLALLSLIWVLMAAAAWLLVALT